MSSAAGAASYVAMARLTGSPVRPGPTVRGSLAGPASRAEAIELEAMTVPEQPFGERFADRVQYLREAWAQTTFYLFDPQSWR